MPAYPLFTPDKADIALVRDPYGRAEWRVQYSADDGACRVTIFTGPDAEPRARDYHGALKSGALKLHPGR